MRSFLPSRSSVHRTHVKDACQAKHGMRPAGGLRPWMLQERGEWGSFCKAHRIPQRGPRNWTRFIDGALSLGPCMAEGRESSLALFYKDTHPILRAPPLWPHHLLEAPLVTASHWGLDLNIWIWREERTQIFSPKLKLWLISNVGDSFCLDYIRADPRTYLTPFLHHPVSHSCRWQGHHHDSYQHFAQRWRVWAWSTS